jgi:threonylcarbamoyladenosine tRNA methylthiotransferase MtaB
MPHLHLSLQHGDDLILKRMKRRHLRDDSIRFCQEVRKLRPEIAFGADLIAGFPTETEEMFESTLSMVDECGLDFLHVFPFSPRKGTPAAKMPQLERALIKDRANRLREKGDAALKAHLAGMAGNANTMQHCVLMEIRGYGRVEQFTRIKVEDGSKLAPGTLCHVEVTGHDERELSGRVTDIISHGNTLAA